MIITIFFWNKIQVNSKMDRINCNKFKQIKKKKTRILIKSQMKIGVNSINQNQDIIIGKMVIYVKTLPGGTRPNGRSPFCCS